MRSSGDIAAMKSPWAMLVLVNPRNCRVMLNPKHSPAGATRSIVARDGSGVPVRARLVTRRSHQRIDDPMRRHHAITEPGMPGHLITERLSANSSTDPTTASMPIRRSRRACSVADAPVGVAAVTRSPGPTVAMHATVRAVLPGTGIPWRSCPARAVGGRA